MAEAARGRVPRRGSGRKTQGSLLERRSVRAWTTVRGKVAKPTHHQERRKWVFWKVVIRVGSRAGEVEKTLAISLGWEVEEERVMVVLMGGLVPATTGVSMQDLDRDEFGKGGGDLE